MNPRLARVIETGLVIIAVVLGIVASEQALSAALAQAAERSGEVLRTLAEVERASRWASLEFGLGALALVAGSWAGRLRGGNAISVPFLLPAAVAAIGLGFAMQMGYGDPLRGPGWPGPSYATGVLMAGLTGGAILAAPFDWERVFVDGRRAILASIVITFGLLWAFGSGPEGSQTRINLGPFQPLEFVKLGFVAFVAVFLGRRASMIRYQRNNFLRGLLRVPRPRLLFPAVLVLLVIFAGLFLVRDLGPILILGLTFLTLFTVVTRSPPWAFGALGVVTLIVTVLANMPDVVGSRTLALRMRMWLDPWMNALPNGDQLVASRWAIAAGGWFGQGFGNAAIGALPAGQTDLALAHLAEELGVFGVSVYLGLLFVVIASGVWTAAQNRTPERVLLAIGFSALLTHQWIVIFGGTTGVLPLTGVIVPFLSAGRTSMIAFVALVAFIGALARDGAVRASTDELEQLRDGTLGVGAALGLAFVAAFAILAAEGGFVGPATSVRGVVTTLGDGTVVVRHDRRIEAIAKLVPRGRIVDRFGRVLAEDDADHRRVTPLGPALGTLLGPATGEVLRPDWSIEKRYAKYLRGYGDAEDGPSMWLTSDGQTEEVLFVSPTRKVRPRDQRRVTRHTAETGSSVRQVALPAPDYRPLVPILHTAPEDRSAAVLAKFGPVESRTMALTLDAQLQAATHRILTEAAAKGKAAAAVVIDVATGDVLVRAQVPDYDPSDRRAWLRPVLTNNAAFVGVYGPWSDLTGRRGIFQAGSVGKIFTSLAVARQRWPVQGQGCETTTVKSYGCVSRDREGPRFTRPGWRRAIHDYYKDDLHGRVDLRKAIGQSCNVTFGQIALDLGPQPFADLVHAGLSVGWSDDFQAGKAGTRALAETGFGQGATALSVLQAARMTAAVAGDGVVKTCSPHLRLGARCDAVQVVDYTRGLQAILAGMRSTITEGTGKRLPRIKGVRVYGKTGTADSLGLADEAPYGIEPGAKEVTPHSWFIAIGEPEGTEACGSDPTGRLAVAVVVPRAGTGASAAAPAALKVLRAAHEQGYFGDGA
ncbi:MAG: FtsW/RodA/SpoVE family cell cycle protein [Myxococcota bacterium]